jgi:L-amino acid N-acyltransferase YncA
MSNAMQPRFDRASNTSTRFAELGDVSAIYALGMSTDTFRVSDALPFYTERELVEWCADRRDNVLMLAETEGAVIGFAFCKLMSYRWALLETVYIAPDYRATRIGERLRFHMVDVVRERGIMLVSAMIRADHPGLVRLSERIGWDNCGEYTWMNLAV